MVAPVDWFLATWMVRLFTLERVLDTCGGRAFCTCPNVFLFIPLQTQHRHIRNHLKFNTLHVEQRLASGQVRPVRQRRARFRAQAQKVKMKICAQLLFTWGKNRQTNQDVSSIGWCPMPHLSHIQDSHIGSTHQVSNPRFRGRPTRRLPKGCQESKVEPTDAQANWQHVLPNSSNSCK